MASDFETLMQMNLTRVFNERDAARRLEAIAEIYDEQAVLYEPHAVAIGHQQISKAVSDLLASLPPDFGFVADGPAVGHHGVGRLRWKSGLAGMPPAVTGTDVARIEEGKIRTLHVFLDPTSA